jgi:hypothetical protein
MQLNKCFFGSLTRISDLERGGFTVEPWPRDRWRTGDYVVGEVESVSALNQIELTTGRMTSPADRDWIVGALGRRAATLEAVGDWQALGGESRLDALTAAGVLGKCTAKSKFTPALISLEYRGHVFVQGQPRNMRDDVPSQPSIPCDAPIVLIIGTSMDAGKTMTARVLIRLLKARGLRVGGVKFTGVGRYRDILAMADAGADTIVDFVDAGLPSTACPPSEFEPSIDYLLTRLAMAKVDVIVAEAGASPLEPYNGGLVIQRIEQLVRCTVLCASDPYAVIGVMNAFGTKPDLIAGRATSTTAAVDLVEKLCRVKALNVLDPSRWPELDKLLAEALGI